MKASKQRKMMKAIVSNKALKGIEAKRLTDMQGKVFENYDFWKGYRNMKQEKRTAMAFAGRCV